MAPRSAVLQYRPMSAPPYDELQAWARIAIDLARAAGDELLRHDPKDLEIETKSSDIDLVTSADRASEALIVAGLRAAFPTHGILAEESGRVVDSDGLLWMVDPLDGTTNFAHGFPHYAVVLGLYNGAQGVLGVVHDPNRNETFWAARGAGAWLWRPTQPAKRLQVSSATRLRQSLLATGFVADLGKPGQDNMDAFRRVSPEVQGIRRPGSAALDLAYVAAGRLDGYWELGLQPWDWAAGSVIVREAGGTAWSGAERDWKPGDRRMVAATPAIAAELWSVLWP